MGLGDIFKANENDQLKAKIQELESSFNNERNQLQARIAELEVKNTALTDENAQLKSQITELENKLAALNQGKPEYKHTTENAPQQTQTGGTIQERSIVPKQSSHSSPQATSHEYRITPAFQYNRIPQEILELLWFSSGPLKNYSGEVNETSFDFAGHTLHIKTTLQNEPSAIDIELPIANAVSVSPAPLDYYPSYERLTPQQRADYLNWLTDITAPIDIGYVFIFYYGLERHLLFGNSESALATILILRQFHDNGSFLSYSEGATVLYAIKRKKWEILLNLDTKQLTADMSLLISAVVHQSLNAQDIMDAHRKFVFENNRYIKSEPELFLSTLEKLLVERYASVSFPVYPEDIAAAKAGIPLVLANYSLLPEQRVLDIPDITTSPRIYNEIKALLVNTHETVKIKLREQRKKQ